MKKAMMEVRFDNFGKFVRGPGPNVLRTLAVISRSTIAKVDSSTLKGKLRYPRVRVLRCARTLRCEITFTENIGIFARNISPEDINHLLLALTKEGKISVIGFTTMKARTKERQRML